MDSSLTSFLLMLVVDEEAAAIFRSSDPKKAGLRQMLIDSAVPPLSDEAKLVLLNHDLNGIRSAVNSTQSGQPPTLEANPRAARSEQARTSRAAKQAPARRVSTAKAKKR
jgi:hypothetical protein